MLATLLPLILLVRALLIELLILLLRLFIIVSSIPIRVILAYTIITSYIRRSINI